MIYQFEAYHPRDRYEKIILIYGEKKFIFQLWCDLDEKYIIHIFDEDRIRVNPKAGIFMPPINNKDLLKFEEEENKRFLD